MHLTCYAIRVANQPFYKVPILVLYKVHGIRFRLEIYINYIFMKTGIDDREVTKLKYECGNTINYIRCQ